MRSVLLIFAVMHAVCCAPRAELVLAPQAALSSMIEPVFVATTRPLDDGGTSDARVATLAFARIDVAIPPDREPGDITWPDNGVNIREDFTVTASARYPDATGFRGALRREIAARPAGERDVVVFVHGYNNTFADGVFRTAQIRHDFDLPAVAAHYAWSTSSSVFGYVHDRDSALFARDGLEHFLRDILASGADSVVLVAHSLGGELVMETLRQIRISGDDAIFSRLSGVILISPDIAVQVFRSQAQRIAPLPQPFVIFISQRDQILRLSAMVSGEPARLGNIGTPEDVAEFNITLIDTTEFSGGTGDTFNHTTASSSAAMIGLLRNLPQVNGVFAGDRAGQAGLIAGTVLTVRNASQIFLEPNF